MDGYGYRYHHYKGYLLTARPAGEGGGYLLFQEEPQPEKDWESHAQEIFK
jgi:hypothetical protein